MPQTPRIPPTRRLPSQPNLDQLRKQAKELLASYRAGESETVAEVERFERSPDPVNFALNDAQRILARAYGYESWPRLKAFIDGVNAAELAAAVQSGDIERARKLLHARPELISKDLSESNEYRAIHFAVIRRDAAMTRFLMEAGSDARKGIYPHRDATTAYAIAREREYAEIVAVIEEVEGERRRELSCPNVTISPVQDQIGAAIRRGDTAAAIRLLETDASLMRACDRAGANPLHLAAEEADLELMDWLLARGASVLKRDRDDHTPLDRAALAVDPRNDLLQTFPEVARRLIERGAEITVNAAVALGDVGRVRQWIATDDSLPRQISPDGGLLTLAVKHAQIDVARLLLDLGADVDERITLPNVEEPTASWGMPLWYAALGNYVEIARLLLDRGADPNANVYASGWPLQNAWNHPDGLLKMLLLERGALPQPYMLSETHDVEGARKLLDRDHSEELAHELAWSACDQGCPEILALALPRLPYAPDDSRWHWILIQPPRGATDDHGNADKHYACMRALLAHGVSPNITSKGQSVLHFTAGYTGSVHDEVRAIFAAMLVEAGARLDIRDDLLRSTPLAWACRWGRPKMIETLIAHGATVDEPDAEPWATPRAWARKMGHEAMLERAIAR
ncbi:MAG TPA: ankyrin repeat domain-containing protein [Bryobacteraceae bacterium]|nr:ankyrin repeat domain-containing protein [Bryobacteraceae bacterium]